MTLVWSGVAFVVLVFGGFATPWDAITRLLENRGVGEEDTTLIAFVAGYTFPLTLATLGLVFAALAGWFEGIEAPYAAVIAGGVLIGAGFLAADVGLGLLPNYSLAEVHGPPYIAIPLFALQGYFNTYGWSLMLCSIAIGSAAAVQIQQWLTQVGAKP